MMVRPIWRCLNGRVLLLHNEKNGQFKDVTAAAGIQSEAAHIKDFPESRSMAAIVDGLQLNVTFIDYDHDGDLDL